MLKTNNEFTEPNLPTRRQCGFIENAKQMGVDLAAGDVRVTTTPTLGAIQTIFHKEHNRIARNLLPFFMESEAFTSMSKPEQDEFLYQVYTIQSV